MEEIYKTVPESSDPVQAKVNECRNGPAKFEFGDTKYNHWFDGMAMIHRFKIQDGKVTYHNKFLRSDAYLKNLAANRIVVSEFGTARYPDPCKNIFQRFFSYFHFDLSDNNVVSVYPVGDSLYTATEGPYLRKIDPDTLDTLDKVEIRKYVDVYCATAHPHIEPNGTVYNLATGGKGGATHSIIKLTPPEKGEEKFVHRAEIVASLPIGDKWKSSYIHSFAITENYFIILEQPLVIELCKAIRNNFFNIPFNEAMTWMEGKPTVINIIDRKTGEILNSHLNYTCNPVTFFHHFNAYEQDGYINVDFCATEDSKVLDNLDMEKLQSKDVESFYKTLKMTKAVRVKLPISPNSKRDVVNYDVKENIVHCELHQLSTDLEMPQINYSYNGKKYKYVYGLGGRIMALDCIHKVNVDTGEKLTWYESSCYPSEPVFVPHPKEETEDHGVILSVVLDTRPNKQPFLLVLDARDFTELARAQIDAKIARDLHGYFHNTGQ